MRHDRAEALPLAEGVTVEILYFDGCPNHETLVPHLRELLRRAGVPEMIELRRVEGDAAAQRERFLGSPTVRVNGRDIEPGADARTDFGLKCRIYQTPAGLRGSPLDEWLLDALAQQPSYRLASRVTSRAARRSRPAQPPRARSAGGTVSS